ncbi:hypothetical protein [Streptosporangium sp. G12]
MTPTVGFDEPAREDCALGLEALAGDDEPKLVEAAEGCQIGVGERIQALADGGVGHVEVSQDERGGAFPSGDLDIYPGTAAPATPSSGEEPL